MHSNAEDVANAVTSRAHRGTRNRWARGAAAALLGALGVGCSDNSGTNSDNTGSGATGSGATGSGATGGMGVGGGGGVGTGGTSGAGAGGLAGNGSGGSATGGTGTGGTGTGGVGNGGTAGTGTGGNGTGGAGGGPCVPDEAVYQSTTKTIVDAKCLQCHGTTPTNGAPGPLAQYADFLAKNRFGEDIHDLVAQKVALGAMPPNGQPALAQAEAEALVSWASCGADIDVTGGQEVNRDPVVSPPNPPTGLKTLDIKARDFAVGPNVLDHYRCFPYDVTVDSDMFIKRFEMVFDETRVLHHVVLFRDTEKSGSATDYDCQTGMPSGSNYLFAWAPTPFSALEFPDGGLRLKSGERIVMQVHYNNGAGIPDVTDSSGVRLYLTEPTGTEWGMLVVGPKLFSIPARSEGTATSKCRFNQTTTVFAGAPHMHQTGRDLIQDITRAGGATENFITLKKWRFDNELFYSIPVTLNAGDMLTTSCRFENPTDAPITFGPRTTDEMCFDFTYLTPPPAAQYCDEIL